MTDDTVPPATTTDEAATDEAEPDGRIDCARCGVRYLPERTDGECPICRETAPGHSGRAEGDGLDLRTTIVLGMSALNLLFLAVLASLLLT